MLALQLDPAQLLEIIQTSFSDFPHANFLIEDLALKRLRVRLRTGTADLRPGGTIFGPTLMMLADTTTWLLVLAHVGPILQVVTTSLHIDFLRRPPPEELIAEAELIKLGRRLAVTEVRIRSASSTEPVARAGVTHAIP
jgi:uncharacterized protein (TIGR00369 family)